MLLVRLLPPNKSQIIKFKKNKHTLTINDYNKFDICSLTYEADIIY